MLRKMAGTKAGLFLLKPCGKEEGAELGSSPTVMEGSNIKSIPSFDESLPRRSPPSLSGYCPATAEPRGPVIE